MKILVLCLPGIGDALMATPMIKVLRKEMPKAQIDILCMFGGVKYIFKNNPYVNKVYYVSLYKQNKLLGLKRLLPFRNNKYDASILCFPAFRKEYHLVQRIIGAKQRIAHAFKTGYWTEFNFLDTDLISVDEEEHHVINNLNLLKPLGINWDKKYSPSDFKYDLNIDKKDINFGKKYIKKLGWVKNSIIGIHPGSINSPIGILKRWPEKNFAALVKYLIRKNNKIIIFIGPDELDVGEKLFKLINNDGDCILLNSLKFNQSIGILSQIDLLVSNDNGFAHLANALNVKSIILFGPTNMIWCSPYNKKICQIIRKASFEPWFSNDIKVDDPPKGVISGMDAISVEDVLALLHQ